MVVYGGKVPQAGKQRESLISDRAFTSEPGPQMPSFATNEWGVLGLGQTNYRGWVKITYFCGKTVWGPFLVVTRSGLQTQNPRQYPVEGIRHQVPRALNQEKPEEGPCGRGKKRIKKDHIEAHMGGKRARKNQTMV